MEISTGLETMVLGEEDAGGRAEGSRHDRAPERYVPTPRAEVGDKPQASSWSRLDLTAGDLTAVQEGLQALSAAMVLLDDSGHLLFANLEAQTLLAQADGIAVDPANIVRCKDRQAQKELQHHIAPPTGTAHEPAGSGTATFPIRREFGLPLVALVISLTERSLGAAAERRTVILLRDPERELGVQTDLLSSLFGLSSAEGAVVSRLAMGADVEQIAGERGVSIVTVRNQLKSALAKFGVSRQVEMVSLVLRAIQF